MDEVPGRLKLIRKAHLTSCLNSLPFSFNAEFHAHLEIPPTLLLDACTGRSIIPPSTFFLTMNTYQLPDRSQPRSGRDERTKSRGLAAEPACEHQPFCDTISLPLNNGS